MVAVLQMHFILPKSWLDVIPASAARWQAKRGASKANSYQLVIELWGIGDLAIATPFLQAATAKYDVTLLAKPHALDLQKTFLAGRESDSIYSAVDCIYGKVSAAQMAVAGIIAAAKQFGGATV